MSTISTFDLRTRIASDAAENSIMQTITIAVSAILIAAGLVTAPGLINNARDNNARTDLANIAFSQEFNLANTGTYAEDIEALQLSAEAAIDSGTSGPRLTLSGGVDVEIVPGADASGYAVVAISQSGKVFHRISGSGAVLPTGEFNSDGDFVIASAGLGTTLGFGDGTNAAADDAALVTWVEALQTP
jgi:hypothetical protein